MPAYANLRDNFSWPLSIYPQLLNPSFILMVVQQTLGDKSDHGRYYVATQNSSVTSKPVVSAMTDTKLGDPRPRREGK